MAHNGREDSARFSAAPSHTISSFGPSIVKWAVDGFYYNFVVKWKWEGMSLNYMDIIGVVGSIATALALIWALVQHRMDYTQMSKQIKLDNKRFAKERSEFLETQIELRINRLTDITNQYTEIYLVTEKLKWTLQSMKDRVEQEEKLNINDYDECFKKMSNIISDIQPWQQAIIGDLPIDPMTNGYYEYYNYTNPNN